MYIAELRKKLKEACESKVMVRVTSCGHFSVYLERSMDISKVKEIITNLNEMYGSEVKFNRSVGSVDGRVYNWYMSCWIVVIVPLFNNETVKFHVPYVMLKTKIRNRGIPSWRDN
ncbi:hypothetical protein ACWFN4_29585 [Bacillus mycoides]